MSDLYLCAAAAASAEYNIMVFKCNGFDRVAYSEKNQRSYEQSVCHPPQLLNAYCRKYDFIIMYNIFNYYIILYTVHKLLNAV